MHVDSSDQSLNGDAACASGQLEGQETPSTAGASESEISHSDSLGSNASPFIELARNPRSSFTRKGRSASSCGGFPRCVDRGEHPLTLKSEDKELAGNTDDIGGLEILDSPGSAQSEGPRYAQDAEVITTPSVTEDSEGGDADERELSSLAENIHGALSDTLRASLSATTYPLRTTRDFQQVKYLSIASKLPLTPSPKDDKHEGTRDSGFSEEPYYGMPIQSLPESYFRRTDEVHTLGNAKGKQIPALKPQNPRIHAHREGSAPSSLKSKFTEIFEDHTYICPFDRSSGSSENRRPRSQHTHPT